MTTSVRDGVEVLLERQHVDVADQWLLGPQRGVDRGLRRRQDLVAQRVARLVVARVVRRAGHTAEQRLGCDTCWR